jgi:hypothetical protein
MTEVKAISTDCASFLKLTASPHYEDPVPNGCRSDEEAV